MKNAAKVIPINPEAEQRNKTPNSVWAFDLDPVHTWAYWDQAFTKEECERIIEIGEKQGFTKASTKEKKGQSSRDSDVIFLYPSDDLNWAYRRMTDIITSLNERFFKFDLFGATEGFQFTKYTAPGGKYGRHIDSSPNYLVRKLSFTLQLSDPKDYSGGELCLHYDPKPKVMKKEQGHVVVFPSYTLHEVRPITQGTRYSLVSWITGKPFK